MLYCTEIPSYNIKKTVFRFLILFITLNSAFSGSSQDTYGFTLAHFLNAFELECRQSVQVQLPVTHFLPHLLTTQLRGQCDVQRIGCVLTWVTLARHSESEHPAYLVFCTGH